MDMIVSPRAGGRHLRKKWSLLTASLCLLSLLAGRYTAQPGHAPEPDGPDAQTVHEPVAKDFEAVTPYRPAVTTSQGDYTAELIRRAGKILDGDILRVRRTRRDWLRRKLFLVWVTGPTQGTFLEREGVYVHVDSGSELIAINEILMEYKFTRQDFDSPQSVDSFLAEVIALQQGSIGLTPGSSFGLRGMGLLDEWLRGTEKDEAVLRELCEDPEFVFDGDVWTVVFNVFRPDGAVDRWRVVGEHDSRANVNEIWGIRVAPLKPPGTFSYALIG